METFAKEDKIFYTKDGVTVLKGYVTWANHANNQHVYVMNNLETYYSHSPESSTVLFISKESKKVVKWILENTDAIV